ncbi:MAG: FHA domain-containing protein [Desulfovibrio sp.]|nr:MAG: FHA domain-containing protein [Desulfovibrio sp.]
MATLILKYEDEIQGKYDLEEGQTIHVGRKDTNDVVVETLIISGNHCKIDFLKEGLHLTDLKSKNGTFVNGKKVTSSWLKSGDEVTVGKHALIVAMTSEEAMDFEFEEDDMGKTMVLDPGRQAAEEPADDDEPLDGSEPTAVISFLKGGQGEVPLTKRLTKVGKDFSNDVVIGGGFTIGQTAFTISKLPDGYYLSYVGGMAKPKINGRSVGESALLHDFDTIEIGSDKLQFYLKK